MAMPEEIDELERRMMDSKIERTALQKVEDTAVNRPGLSGDSVS